MPPLPAVPNVVRVKLHIGVGPDVSPQTILHFSYSGSAPVAADCAALATDVRTAFGAHVPAYLNSNGALLEVEVQDLGSSTGAYGNDTTHVAGTRSGGELPISCPLLINYQIARRYRGGKPKSFPPLLTVSDINDTNTFNSTTVAAAAAAWKAFLDAVVGAASGSTTITHYVSVSYYSGYNAPVTTPSGRVKQSPKLRVGGPVVDQITGVSGSVNFGAQRRRTRQAA